VSFGEIWLSGITWRLLFVLPEKGTFFQNCGFLWVFQMGFFAEAGPVQIFVSNHLIPDDMVFQSGDVPSYETSDGSVRIQKDSEVRLKIVGTRVDATEIFCIGTIKDDFLGLIGDPGGAT
jgi:DNA-directed RNA polymerase II subunit RPB7